MLLHHGRSLGSCAPAEELQPATQRAFELTLASLRQVVLHEHVEVDLLLAGHQQGLVELQQPFCCLECSDGPVVGCGAGVVGIARLLHGIGLVCAQARAETMLATETR